MSLGGFGSQRHVTERADVVDVDGARPAGERAVVETVHVQLGVAHLDGTDHADDTGLGQGRGQDSHHITALVGGGGVGGDVGLSEGVGGGAPREGGVGEVPGDLLEGSTVLGTVGDHQVIAFFGVPADRRGCVLDYEGSVGDGQLGAGLLGGDHVHRVHDALGEGQVVGGARSNHRDPQRLHRRHHGFHGVDAAGDDSRNNDVGAGSHFGGEVESVVELDHQSAVGEVDLVGLTAQ